MVAKPQSNWHVLVLLFNYPFFIFNKILFLEVFVGNHLETHVLFYTINRTFS